MNFKNEQPTNKFQFDTFNAGFPTRIACDFCPNVFESIADKNSHLLEHFVQELCSDCNEPLIRIGDMVYVLHTKITCIRSNDTEHQYQQTPPLSIEINPKNEIFIDEQHFDELRHTQAPPENQITEEITIDESSIKIEPIFCEAVAVKNSVIQVDQQNDDENISKAEPPKPTRVGRDLNARLRWEKELIECPIDGCGQMIKRRYKAKHIKEKHGAGFKCSTCDDRFLNQGSFKQHVKQCVDSEKFECEFCSALYTSKKALTIHKYENHRSEKEQRKQTNTLERRDRRAEYYKKIIECNFDGCDFLVRRYKMPKHMKDFHGFGHNCTECGKLFLLKEGLEKHILFHAAGAIHVENQIFTCDICNILISTKRSLINHMKHHIPKKNRIECKICGRKLIDKGGLRNHMRYHSESKYICSICGKDFKIKDHLTAHERIHSGEKPYKCNFDCEKMFRTSALRSQHERAVHRGIKPFKCTQPDCSKAYAFDVDLKRHLFSQHSIWTKKHPCPHATCENVIFPERKLLRKHLKTVHGIEA